MPTRAACVDIRDNSVSSPNLQETKAAILWKIAHKDTIREKKKIKPWELCLAKHYPER